MPRTARLVVAGLPHHITQRGNRRQNIFFSDADRVAFLDWLRGYCAENQVQIIAYCLMTNHTHLVAVPGSEEGFERTFRPLHTRYAMRVNRRLKSNGHVWQGRYFASVLDESYFWSAIRYIERNPVRAGIVAKAERYRWSSAAAHCGLRGDPLLSRDPAWLQELASVADWPAWLAEIDAPDRLTELRQQVARGFPCGAPGFVERLERTLGRAIKPQLRGRPKKKK